MLVENSTIWETKIQNVDALLTTAHGERREVYYLATICQVSVDPLLVSIAPNPEYPVCDVVQQSGRFGVNFMADAHGSLIERVTGVDRGCEDKLSAAGLAFELSEAGTPLLLECLLALECRVLRALDSGDHRTFIAEVVGRHPRAGLAGRAPHRFRGGQTAGERWKKRILCATGLDNVLFGVKRRLRPPLSIREGTSRFIGEPHPVTPIPEWLAHPEDGGLMNETPNTERQSTASDRRRLAPERPGVCLVGCGWWGAVHAFELKRLGNSVRRYFASRDERKARSFIHRFDGEAAFESIEQAVADPRVDAVVLALPHHLHAEAATTAMRAGKHVLVEKPLANDVHEAEQLVEIARSERVCLAVAEQYRVSPLVERARSILRDGVLGRISVVHAGVVGNFRPQQDWKNDASTMGGGVLLDVGVHYIDILRYWFGQPDVVWAISPPHLHERLQGEDSITSVIRFPGGPIANLTISWSGFRSPDAPNLEVIGEHGSLELWFKRPYLRLSQPLPSNHWTYRVRRHLPWRLEEMLRRRAPAAQTSRIAVPSDDLIGSRAIIQDFVHAIVTGDAPAVSGSEGLHDLRVVHAAYEALQSGKPTPTGIEIEAA